MWVFLWCPVVLANQFADIWQGISAADGYYEIILYTCEDTAGIACACDYKQLLVQMSHMAIWFSTCSLTQEQAARVHAQRSSLAHLAGV